MEQHTLFISFFVSNLCFRIRASLQIHVLQMLSLPKIPLTFFTVKCLCSCYPSSLETA